MDSTMQDILKFASTYLTPTMIIVFFIGIGLRSMVFWTIKREDWFTKEFDRRVHHFFEETAHDEKLSFFITTKQLLEKSFYELFMMRAIMKRRKKDVILSASDRLFLTQQGAAFIVKSTLRQVKFLKYKNGAPKFLEISKSVCQTNPCFSKILGFIPLGVNDFLGVLPGLFVIGGIFGTFLGIMDGIHSLTAIDISDIEGTQDVMNKFLSHVAFSMSTSIVGIILSVTMTIYNTIFAPEKLFISIVERYENTLDFIWNRCENNIIPENIKNFDEHRDPSDALAEMAVTKELQSSKFANFRDREVYGQHLIDKKTAELKNDLHDDEEITKSAS